MKKAFNLSNFFTFSKITKLFIQAFTLAEVLITLAIIGVVAAISIPSVISNAQQQEFKTGLRKAVSVLNSAITMNIALEGETPYDNHDLFRYLQRHMSVMKSTTRSPYFYEVGRWDGTWLGFGNNKGTYSNGVFYTTDGMRYEVYLPNNANERDNYGPKEHLKLHESQEVGHVYGTTEDGVPNKNFKCGSYGLANNPNNTTATPCIIAVDVNGDRKPFPSNLNATRGAENPIIVLPPNSKKVNDVFSVMITDEKAIPYGVLAQKAMYRAQK